jgi:hypothetical protein
MIDESQRERTLGKLREVCLELPETSERLSHGAPTFFVREKRAFLMVLTDHHGDGRFAIWCAAGDGVQAMLVDADPDKFFVRRTSATGAGWGCVSMAVWTGTSSRELPRTHTRRSHRRDSSSPRVRAHREATVKRGPSYPKLRFVCLRMSLSGERRK